MSARERVIGMTWSRDGEHVVCKVIEVQDDGTTAEVVHLRYTLDQAALSASQLLSAMGGGA